MNSLPFFSIITASLNDAGTLQKTLQSVKGQVCQSVEHIVIDGGSTDATVDTLKSYEDSYNLTWLSEPDHGISDALNKGVGMATGKYVLVIQADDYLVDSQVLADVESFLSNEVYQIYSCPVIVDESDETRRLHGPSKFVNQRYHFKNVFRHQGTFVHRNLYDAVGLFSRDYKISMDYDFFYRALSLGCNYCTGLKPIAIMGGGGISRTQSYQRIKEEVLVQDENEDHFGWRFAQKVFRVFYMPYRNVLHRLARFKE